jgi:hypothetical protein
MTDQKHRRTTVHISKGSIEPLGDRAASTVFNQSIQRLAYAGQDVEITDVDRKFYEANKRKKNSPGYPDQGELLEKFADATGRTISESIVALDKLERTE